MSTSEYTPSLMSYAPTESGKMGDTHITRVLKSKEE